MASGDDARDEAEKIALGPGVWQHTLGGGSGKRPDAGLSEAAFDAAREGALAILDDLAAGLPNDNEIDSARELIGALGRDKRLIAFFASGSASLAAQSVAQFAGWNIPGVGEGDQRFRPRTRLYDTIDPDTLGQVRETLDYSRTAFLFIEDAPVAPVVAWAATLLPEAIARGTPGDWVAYVSAGESRGDAAAHVREAGGRQLTLGNQHALSCAPLTVGIARGLDLAEVRAGARSAIGIIRDACVSTDTAWTTLGWPMRLAAALRNSGAADGNARLHVLPLSDRLARFSAWTASCWTGAPRLDVCVPPQSVSGLTPVQMGLTAHGAAGERQFVDLHVAAANGDTPAGHTFAALRDRLAADAQGAGASVRVLSIDRYTAETYGALALRMMFESRLVREMSQYN
jgi:glucose-6-phosphate isomerase